MSTRSLFSQRRVTRVTELFGKVEYQVCVSFKESRDFRMEQNLKRGRKGSHSLEEPNDEERTSQM